MANIRFSFDTGGGFVVFTAFDNQVTWHKEKITLAAVRVRLEGSVTFTGSEYTTLINFKDAGNNYVPIRVEQDNAGWNTIFEGVAFLLVPWDENRSTITLTDFTNDDEYDNFLSNYDIKYGYRTFSLTDYGIVTPSVVSTTIDAAKVAGTGLSAANYILAYDINGFPLLTAALDPRWAYFLFRSTDAGGHNFETMSYDYDIGAFDFVEIRMLIGGTDYRAKWVKLPPGVGSTQSIINPVATAAYRFPDLLDALIPLANSSLTFTEATAVTYTGQSADEPPSQYAFFDYTKYMLAEASDVANLDAKESSITCKFLLEIMAKCFDLHWYLDGTALKFKHTTELTTSGTLDLSTQTAQLQRLEYIETDIPDIEIFQAKDSKGDWHDTGGGAFPFGKVQIYYRSSNNTLSRRVTKIHDFPVLTNVLSLMSGNFTPDNNDHCLIEVTNDSSTPRVVYGINPDWNVRLSSGQLYGHLNKWRYGVEPDLATRLKISVLSLFDTEPRPLLKIPIINYHEDLVTDYDMDKAITTSAGSGITQNISQDLNSDVLKLEIHL